MRGVWKQFPRDADMGALCAEALMDLHPWDLWAEGRARPWTPEIVAVLERALQLNPGHPGLNHYYIHAVEASPEPGKALAAAHRLRQLVPDSGHMMHMPSHIFARVGDWPRAAEANQEAMKADARYRQAHPRPGFYAMYMAHNAHFLAFTAMMRGRNEETVALARRMSAEIPEDFVAEYGPVADGFLVFPHKALMRFGRWDELLQEPKPRGNLPFSQAMWRWTRAAALTALDRMPEAQVERELFLAAKQATPAEAFFGNNRASDLLEVAVRVLDGEMLAQEGKLAEAALVLEEAVRREDKLRYDEPPDWIQPVRHTLGAVLLRAGRAAEAEKVYRADLRELAGKRMVADGTARRIEGTGPREGGAGGGCPSGQGLGGSGHPAERLLLLPGRQDRGASVTPFAFDPAALTQRCAGEADYRIAGETHSRGVRHADK